MPRWKRGSSGSRTPVLEGDEASEPAPVPEDSPLDPIVQALRKLHNNLGHPSQASLLRVLRNSGASEAAIQRARKFQCSACLATGRPKDALPANPPAGEEFNQRVGLDVKYLDGWKPNHKIPCVNIVDYGSSFQQIIPLYARETGESLREAIVSTGWPGQEYRRKSF